MKKRIVCVLLTLIMLVSLVPAAAVTADAASYSVSESAITVLKRLQKSVWTTECEDGYIGYGTKCPECLGDDDPDDDDDLYQIGSCHYSLLEKEADSLLRAELKELDKAVNAFTTRNNLNVTQSQHDAMVLFSFQNGTAWTYGTGEFQTAIKSGYTGTRFLDAICKWDYDTSDDPRRMVEANMYLNGVYSQYAPSRYICVTFTVDDSEAVLAEDTLQYFDVASPVSITLTPVHKSSDAVFLGWYTEENGGERVSTLNTTHNGEELFALWQTDSSSYEVSYTINKSSLISTTVYNKPEGEKVTTYVDREIEKEVTIKLGDVLYVVEDRIVNGVLWARIIDPAEKDETYDSEIGWVKVKSGTTSSGSDATVDVNVTVTNSYVNMRKNASITSTKNGSFNQGDVLRIIDVQNGGDGFVWGQVATSADDATPIGWVALMYTDYDSVIASSNSASNGPAIATATIIYNGYVNVRCEAGTNNQIVGALSKGVTVDLYETKYVNGVQWGRCSTGWFCLNYARVTGLSTTSGDFANVGFANYVFSGDLIGYDEDADNFVSDFEFYTSPYSTGEEVEDELDENKDPVPMTSGSVTISNLIEVDGDDWGKTNYGWIKLSEIELDEAEFYVIADTATVRASAATSATRLDLLVTGTAFVVTEIDVVGDTIWGETSKVDGVDMEYNGWVNLSNSNVSRNGAPEASIGGSGSAGTTVKMAKVVGTQSLRVRITGATYGKQIGSLAYGTTAAVLEENNGWYNLDIDVDNDPSTGSWVSGTYLEFYEATVGGSSSSSSSSSTGSTSTAVETGTGIVANTYTGVNIRTGAGTAYPATGKYLTGTNVEILEVTTVGASKWGRTEKGWVCMDYIVMVSNFNPSGSTGGSSSSTSSEVAIYTGQTTNEVTIYKDTTTIVDTDTNTVEPAGQAVRTVDEGYPLTVHEIIVKVEYENEDEDPDDDGQTTTVTTRTTFWARVNEGYIYAPAANIELDTLDEHVYTVGVSSAKVYVAPKGSAYSWTLSKGNTVRVTKLEIHDSNVWGYVELDSGKEGWTKMSNMTKGFASTVETEDNSSTNETTATEPTTPSTVIGSTGNTTGGYVGTSGYKYTGKVINTNSLNVRATASQNATKTTTLSSGAALVIYETVISEGMAWGRCDSGWVYLYYVDLTPVGNGAVDARVVYNDNTIIYADMNCSEKTGSTYAKMAVIDIYEIVGKMARTELGWVNTDNLL